MLNNEIWVNVLPSDKNPQIFKGADASDTPVVLSELDWVEVGNALWGNDPVIIYNCACSNYSYIVHSYEGGTYSCFRYEKGVC